MRGSVSLAMAASSAGSAFCVARLEHRLGRVERLAGSGDSSVSAPIAASIERRSRLLRRDRLEVAGRGAGDGGAGRRVDELAVGVLVEDLLLLGAELQPAVLRAPR